MKVLISKSDVPSSAITLLRNSNLDLIINEENSRKSLLNKIVGVDAVLWATKHRFDEEMLIAAGSNLKIVATMSAGLDHIAVDALKKYKIKLSNTHGVLNSAVADMAILLTLAASRRLHEGRQHIENGTWVSGNQWMLGQDISHSTVGIVGLGGIGQCIAKKLSVFNVEKILYSGHKEKEEGIQLNAKFVSFDELLSQSDFIIVSCPLTNETYEMFNEVVFNKMKKTSVFVNVSRGSIVHQPSLVEALKTNKIYAAGLDVMVPEPLPQNDELLKLPNCVIVPHLGSATFRTRKAMAELAANNIIAALNGEPLLTPV